MRFPTLAVRKRAQTPCPCNERLGIRREVGRQQADGHGASEARVARAIEIPGPCGFETLEQVVVGDDANRGGRRRGHERSVSITLCTQSTSESPALWVANAFPTTNAAYSTTGSCTIGIIDGGSNLYTTRLIISHATNPATTVTYKYFAMRLR